MSSPHPTAAACARSSRICSLHQGEARGRSNATLNPSMTSPTASLHFLFAGIVYGPTDLHRTLEDAEPDPIIPEEQKVRPGFHSSPARLHCAVLRYYLQKQAATSAPSRAHSV